MGILKYAIENPVKVIVVVLFIVLFGVQSLRHMPYQLSPSVEYPTITVRTTWSGATPYEIEMDIVDPQENVLKSLPGLIEMESNSSNGSGSITLKFDLGSDLMDCMLQVSNKLNEVRSYPDNVDKPVIRASPGSDGSPVVYMLFTLDDDNPNDMDSYQTYVEDDIVPRFERITGVSDVFFYGGKRKQMQVTVVPEKMAAYNISINELSTLLKATNKNTSGGTLSVGRKDYRVRTISEFKSAEDIEETIVLIEGGAVKVSDFASVDYGYAKATSAVKTDGSRTMMIGIVKEAGANVLELTDNVEKVYNELNERELIQRGIQLRWIYDQRPYISGAIDLVKSNIIVGSLLAIAVLLLFLRNIPSTLVVSTSIPISVIGTFIILNFSGKSLNVISLAGIAFAVGILIDNAIVVLENIDRHRKEGKSPFNAALDGATEVWGAVLASSLTTVAVFLPIVFIKEESGQLFKDIAIAVSAAVMLSMVVSMTVVPMLSKILYEKIKVGKTLKLADLVGRIGKKLSRKIMLLSVWINRRVVRKVAVVLLLTTFSVLTVMVMMPKMEYLPLGNMNMVSSVFILPSGLSLDERERLGDMFYGEVKEYIGVEKDGYPAIKNFFYSANPNNMTATATAEDPLRAAELVPLLTTLMEKIPGVTGFTSQTGIFQNRGAGGRNIEVIVSGDELDGLVSGATAIIQSIYKNIPGAQVRPMPSVEMMYPEASFVPDRERLKDVSMTATTLGQAVYAYIGGLKVDDFKDPELGKIDLVVRSDPNQIDNPYKAAEMPLAVSGKIVPISGVSSLELGQGLDGIRRYERRRTFTLSVSAPDNMVLEDLKDNIENKVVVDLKKSGVLDGLDIHYSGSASKLADAKNAFMGNFLLAIIITYLLMVALFDNFFYPLIILFSVPMALAGGFIGLKVVDTFVAPQSFDVLTMLGFVLLVGVVINNAILIVHQTQNNIKIYKMGVDLAINTAVKERLRPIAMSAATSLFGMLPLVIAPGPGSELYRGIGSVVLGGLLISTVFTVFMIPALLSILMSRRKIKLH